MSELASPPQPLAESETEGRETPASVLVATMLLGLKAVLGLWGGLALLTASPSHHRRFLTEVIRDRHRSVGVMLLVLVAVAFVVLIGLVRLRLWGWVGALALEAVGVVLALSKVASRPAPATVSLALSAGVTIALLTPSAVAAFRRGGRTG